MIVLKGGRLIDGTGAAPVNGTTIIVKYNRIEDVTTGQLRNGRASFWQPSSRAAR